MQRPTVRFPRRYLRAAMADLRVDGLTVAAGLDRLGDRGENGRPLWRDEVGEVYRPVQRQIWVLRPGPSASNCPVRLQMQSEILGVVSPPFRCLAGSDLGIGYFSPGEQCIRPPRAKPA